MLERGWCGGRGDDVNAVENPRFAGLAAPDLRRLPLAPPRKAEGKLAAAFRGGPSSASRGGQPQNLALTPPMTIRGAPGRAPAGEKLTL
jgi:hypothetical protein